MKPSELLENYDSRSLRVATIGSHSALDICAGAKKHALGTIAVCARGREETYAKHYKTREKNGRHVGCVDEVLVLEGFKQLAEEKTIASLREKNALFVPHKTLSAHLSQEQIEGMHVPFFGNRFLLAAEERGHAKDQNFLFQKGGLAVPQKFPSPSQIDALAIVKAVDQTRGYYERAFFLCSTPAEYEQKSGELLSKGIISREGLEKAVIEEFVLGAQVNFNFFFSPLDGELELLGTDFRRQTNLDGLLRIPAKEQLQLAEGPGLRETTVEVGHVASTVRESLLEQAFKAAEKFVEACASAYAPGIIGPFALQGAIAQKGGREQFVVFDASLRVPGSPGTRFTPYSHYLYGESVSTGERIAQEIVRAAEKGVLEKIVT